ncbi:YihY/virulence factor BrkB family protein [Hymenobacter lutimineralis]|uniref:YihY/virulence factor BrkB family protein n=1 Tax=Hymenobacter lutimineralis TaxID=2606448 RepID=A0A5D6V941_9BACT|nr:YihY/virulence factor BrkB family protein [Hymenobacter lutimineralis]QIX62568.1 YihY/virulence factor BrkB family protein [Hymenobacter sp. BT18]TYZ11870.1 YihY/virulence factor BrkB family protein [Hymenobacter lutimineralis]
MRLPRRYRVSDVRRNRPYRRLMVWLKRLRFNRGQASVYDVVDHMIQELKLDSVTKRASYMAFNFTIAIFPTIIFLFTLIPYIPVPNLNLDILQFLSDLIPQGMYVVIADTIEDIVNIPHGGLLSFGFGTALVLSSNGIMALLDAFDKKYHTFKRRTYLRKRVIATLLTVVLAMVLIVAIAGIFFGTYIIDTLVFYEIVPERLTALLTTLLRYGSVVGLFLFTTCLIYYYVPAVQDRWPFLSAGAVVATLLIFLVSFLFILYIKIFDSYNHFYGSIGALVGFMVWLDFVCMTLIVGFEVNVSIDAVTGRLKRYVVRTESVGPPTSA